MHINLRFVRVVNTGQMIIIDEKVNDNLNDFNIVFGLLVCTCFSNQGCLIFIHVIITRTDITCNWKVLKLIFQHEQLICIILDEIKKALGLFNFCQE